MGTKHWNTLERKGKGQKEAFKDIMHPENLISEIKTPYTIP
jgi:hypothetical protein